MDPGDFADSADSDYHHPMVIILMAGTKVVTVLKEHG